MSTDPKLDHRAEEAAVRIKEMEAAKAELDLSIAAAGARRDQLKAMVPDLSGVDRGSLELSDSAPMWGTYLTFAAITEVGDAIANNVLGAVKKAGGTDGSAQRARILITSEADLASLDVVHDEVTSGIKELTRVAETVLGATEPAGTQQQPEGFLAQAVTAAAGGLVNPVAGIAMGAAALLPSVLSLLSVQRTVSTGPVSAGDLAAAAAVSRRLASGTEPVSVVHDGFRLVGGHRVMTRFNGVLNKRGELVARQVELMDQKTIAEEELARAKAAGNPVGVAEHSGAVARATTRLALVNAAVANIDAFTTTARSVPQGGRRSLLAMACMQEVLHGDRPEGQDAATGGDEAPDPREALITYVLLTKAHPGQAQQVLEHRIICADRFTTYADITVTYLLIRAQDSTVVDAGSVTGTASARGNVGEAPQLEINGRTCSFGRLQGGPVNAWGSNETERAG